MALGPLATRPTSGWPPRWPPRWAPSLTGPLRAEGAGDLGPPAARLSGLGAPSAALPSPPLCGGSRGIAIPRHGRHGRPSGMPEGREADGRRPSGQPPSLSLSTQASKSIRYRAGQARQAWQPRRSLRVGELGKSDRFQALRASNRATKSRRRDGTRGAALSRWSGIYTTVAKLWSCPHRRPDAGWGA